MYVSMYVCKYIPTSRQIMYQHAETAAGRKAKPKLLTAGAVRPLKGFRV